MKQITFYLSVILVLFGAFSCANGVTGIETPRMSPTADLTVYYFHFTRSCATCLAVEENARKAVEEMYPVEVKTGDYAFTSMNLDEAGVKEIADKLGVGGQTLLVVHGDKKIDITSEAWLNAHDPEKMKVEIKSGIEKVMF